ncbi:DNA ligase D [Bacillus sp. T33-2]|uniref:DNA ligase D n=1 Tax=Bacillus sp. T33-2 TaxID=2054168 RepID=UPI000C77E97E|nr:DNA ligase D [Bacillus sp. T33-2]PLR98842.1 DNA ligase D [Bacillus sp. T33-2]
MKPMLPTLTFDPPRGSGWRYEVKYDGFRAILEWGSYIRLTSRNGKPLLGLFPEIEQFLLANEAKFHPLLPLSLDGELVVLENPYKANFGTLQVRGRMRSKDRIAEKARNAPCTLLIFDILQLKGKPQTAFDYETRKRTLETVFQAVELPLRPGKAQQSLVQMIPSHDSLDPVWEKVVLHDGEGIVAKRLSSIWEEGKRAETWVKLKNWKYVSCFVTAYEKPNGYFYVSVFKNNEPHVIGSVLFGFKPDEKQALYETIKGNNTGEDDRFIHVSPGICLDVKYLELYEDQLREPHFHQFRFDLKAEECTFERFVQQQKNVPADIEITNPDKPLWESPAIKKIDYIHYLREISPYMLPFLKDRLLTVIRYPHGMFGEAFYQKNCPEYAPEFVQTEVSEGIEYIVCNNLKTFMWLGNQVAVEFHIPFQSIQSKGPSEIVLDLDPPSKNAFNLAIKAALLIKDVLDQLKLISFIKTSGNKGLQVYIPLPENRYSFDETRMFTSFVAQYLVSNDPDSFTIERMKKNRGNRLYVDYVQHAEGKTIISPYSPRGNKNATVAAPLFWDEVNEQLTMEAFQITNIIERINKKGCPFQHFFTVKEEQNFDPVLDFLKGKTSSLL